MMKQLLLAALTVAALTGCTGTVATSGSEVTPDARYGSVEALKDAAVEAGLTCPRYRETNRITEAAQSAECSADAVLATFTSERDKDRWLTGYRELADMLGLDPVLVGPNWMINATNAEQLQPMLGGVLDASR